MKKEDRRKVVVPFTLEQFKDAIQRIEAEYSNGKLQLVGLFEIETLEYFYQKAKENENENENEGYSYCPVCGKSSVYDIHGDKLDYCGRCGKRIDWSMTRYG